MTVETLLADLEEMPDADRVRYMVEGGRQAQSDAETAAVLKTLAAGGFYERRLALFACSGSRESALPLQALSDPSRLLRGLAIGLVPVLCSDEQVVEALKTVPQSLRLALLGRLVRRKRRAPVDAFLGQTHAPVDALFDRLSGSLSSYGSADVLRRQLESVLPQFGVSDWQRLARRHPDTAIEILERQANALFGPDARLRQQVNAVVPVLADTRPDALLSLLRAVLRQASLSQITLQPLVKRRPNEMADLVLASEDRPVVHFGALVRNLTTDRLLALVRQQPELLGSPAHWMRRLPPETRQAVYDAAGLGWRSREGVLDYTVAAVLPGAARALEARRHLSLPALATRPAQRLPYAALLPWEEARSILDPSVRSPDPDLRAAALSALIGAARYQRERLPDALAVVRARANEQDPVRRAMLSALAALPPTRWATAHLEDLGQIIRDALSAADLSLATASAAEKLVVSLVPGHPEWAAPWLGTLAKERGQIQFHALGDRLSDRDVERIAPALLPVLASWETRERQTFLIQAARSLGRRLRVFTALAEMLERVLAVTPHSYYASQILALLAEHRPDLLPVLIPRLIAQDKSNVTLPVVYQYLHRRRQDLITPFLGQTAYGGRFSTGQTRFVLPLKSGFERWTPAQQEVFSQTLDRVTRDTARDTPSIFLVIIQLAALPSVPPDRLIELARPAANPAVRDAALRALARLDAGQGVPVLVEALDDERARIAIYALRTALLEMPPDAALTLLRAVPTGKVTVAKEVVRLLGELKTPDAYPVLLEMAEQDLYRDVRVALLRALWDHLEQDATWPYLERAAADPEPAVAGGVVRIPTDRLSPRSQQRLVSLMVLLLGHPDAKIRLDVLARCVDLPLPDPAETLMPRLLPLMGSRLPDESAAAARAVFATYAGAQAGAVGAAMSAVLPNRRALTAAANALQAVLARQRGRQQPTVRAVIAALESDPLTASLRVELALSGLPWDEATVLLLEMAEAGELNAEALMAAVRALERGGSRPAGLAEVEASLAASPDERLRRLALAALLAQSTDAEGWTEERRHRLDSYRLDSASLVAAAAQFTFPPDDVPILAT